MTSLAAHEYGRVLVVVDSKRRFTYVTVERQPDEPLEAYADRVRAAVINVHTQRNA